MKLEINFMEKKWGKHKDVKITQHATEKPLGQ